MLHCVSKDPFPNKVTITFGDQDREDFEGHHQHPTPMIFSLLWLACAWIHFEGNHCRVKSGSALQQSVETLREEGSPGSPTAVLWSSPRLASPLLSQPEAVSEGSPGVCRRSSEAPSPGWAPPKASLPGLCTAVLSLCPHSHLSRTLVLSQSSLAAGVHSHLLGARWCSNLFLGGSLDQGSTTARPHFTLVTSSTGPVSSASRVRAETCIFCRGQVNAEQPLKSSVQHTKPRP